MTNNVAQNTRTFRHRQFQTHTHTQPSSSVNNKALTYSSYRQPQQKAKLYSFKEQELQITEHRMFVSEHWCSQLLTKPGDCEVPITVRLTAFVQKQRYAHS